MIETEFLIVGGGPAGATVAKYLSIATIPNILIQKKFDFKKPCGGGLRKDAFTEFDLDTNMIQKQLDEIHLVFKNKREIVDIQESPLVIVGRREFDSYLRDEAQKNGTTLHEAKLVDVEVQDDCVISTVNFAYEIKKIKSKYLIAADGVNSSIRKKINGDNVSAQLTSYADLLQYRCGVCEFHFGSKIAGNFYAWSFPEGEGTNIGIVAHGEIPYMNNFIKLLDINEEFRVKGYKIPEFENTLFYKNRVFFVGDSASQVLPFTYEGIYYAISSAKILADVLIEKCDPNEYEKRWNKKYLKKFTTLKKLQKIFLYNDFTISLMMRLYKSKSIQKKILGLWFGDKEIHINLAFFLKVLKKVF
ncbi:NAD(P)/FAD-dependent oxidoreductase [bacterium]|nr:NAD(P)/FAD-dependent oxidoreductase [bacterium]MBU4023716.1 NAD(P)/FAD-dependent oxidoreductase [bacterium]MBU4110110.1 NAD(P)/FAD-dependent oxidoreductase [bacterium]